MGGRSDGDSGRPVGDGCGGVTHGGRALAPCAFLAGKLIYEEARPWRGAGGLGYSA